MIFRNGRKKKTLTGYTDGVNPVVFSPDGAMFLIGGHGISLWDIETGQYKMPLARDKGLALLKMAKKGCYLALLPFLF